jgi:phospholipase C
MGEGPIIRSRYKRLRPFIAIGAAAALAAGAAIGATTASASTTLASRLAAQYPGYSVPGTVSASFYRDTETATPIKHIVVIFDENVSFDHYFGTYPYAANTDGTTFKAKPGTPAVNGLYTKITKSGPVGPLLTSNPNVYNPQRLTPAQALTSDQNHGYVYEQRAEDNGKMDQFVQNTESTSCSAPAYCPPGIVMDYYDGNTATAMWNYAQYYSMSDNNWDTTFGPSTPGALNVSSGNTGDAKALSPAWSSTPGQPAPSSAVTDVQSNGLGTMSGDVDPYYDQCSDGNHTSVGALGAMTGANIGDLLNTKHITWGWFQGGFAPTSTNSGGAVCGSTHANISGVGVADYSPHHNPFQYYASTANPAHLAPTSEAAIGRTDQANHQYDLSAFNQTLKDGNLPSVSYLKAAEYQDGHPGYSDPLDEQNFIVNTVNQIERSKYWPSTAIVITYDDSDGWYDHQAPTIVNGSNDPANDTAECTSAAVTLGTYNDRCGYSQRLPMVVISPWTRENYVSHNLTNTASVVKFIEDNWLNGERIPGSFDAISGSLDARGGLLDFNTAPHLDPVILNPATGAVVSSGDRGKQ